MLGHHSFGSGPHRVLLFNDWTQDTTSWDPVRPHLDVDACTWTFVDLRGYGASRHLRGEHSAQEGADDILALADAQGWERFSVVGHSMSTLVALHLAQHAPDRVRRAVLVCPPPPGGFGAPDEVLAQMAAIARGGEATRAALFGERLGATWAAWKARAWCATSTPEAVEGSIALFARDGVPEPTRPVDLPVRVLCGEEDQEAMRSTPVRDAYGALCSDLEVVGLPGVGHYPMIELPPRTAALLNRHLA